MLRGISIFFLLFLLAFQASSQNAQDSKLQNAISLYLNGDFQSSKTQLLELLKTQKSPSKDLLFYLGKSHHATHNFEEAVQFYKSFLRETNQNNPRRATVKNNILNCAVGLKISSYSNKTDLTMTKNGHFDRATFDDYQYLNDSVMIVSSREKGGFGGDDLYFKIKKGDKWSEIINFGKEINTEWDERFPFVSEDGQTLYFSSNNCRKSMGGFDIFKSQFNPNTQTWMTPENLGFPINSASNEVYLRIYKDPKKVYFSFNRNYHKHLDNCVAEMGLEKWITIDSNDFPNFWEIDNSTEVHAKDSEDSIRFDKTKGLSYQILVTSQTQSDYEKLRAQYPKAMSFDSDFQLKIGRFKTFRSAHLFEKNLRNQGISNLKILAFFNGNLLTQKQVQNHTETYPDLKRYLEESKE